MRKKSECPVCPTSKLIVCNVPFLILLLFYFFTGNILIIMMWWLAFLQRTKLCYRACCRRGNFISKRKFVAIQDVFAYFKEYLLFISSYTTYIFWIAMYIMLSFCSIEHCNPFFLILFSFYCGQCVVLSSSQKNLCTHSRRSSIVTVGAVVRVP